MVLKKENKQIILKKVFFKKVNNTNNTFTNKIKFKSNNNTKVNNPKSKNNSVTNNKYNKISSSTKLTKSNSNVNSKHTKQNNNNKYNKYNKYNKHKNNTFIKYPHGFFISLKPKYPRIYWRKKGKKYYDRRKYETQLIMEKIKSQELMRKRHRGLERKIILQFLRKRERPTYPKVIRDMLFELKRRYYKWRLPKMWSKKRKFKSSRMQKIRKREIYRVLVISLLSFVQRCGNKSKSERFLLKLIRFCKYRYRNKYYLNVLGKGLLKLKMPLMLKKKKVGAIVYRLPYPLKDKIGIRVGLRHMVSLTSVGKESYNVALLRRFRKLLCGGAVEPLLRIKEIIHDAEDVRPFMKYLSM